MLMQMYTKQTTPKIKSDVDAKANFQNQKEKVPKVMLMQKDH